ncbi:hypothetical protein bcere0009_8750 [Bacillus cereus R309803]|nr:hypothetical protein bcere0009_8750 [Bacillus cereus R309803]
MYYSICISVAYLIGTNEFRLEEMFGALVFKIITPLLVGFVRKYRLFNTF